jgi:GNAT superfamily N-acetyltransferase
MNLRFCNDLLPKFLQINTPEESSERGIYTLSLDNVLVGVVEMPEGKRVGAFYLTPKYQGQGIGRRLLETFRTSFGQKSPLETGNPHFGGEVSEKSRSSWSHIIGLSRQNTPENLGWSLLFGRAGSPSTTSL